MTDTGWLKFPNASTKTFGVVQKLVSTGFNRSEVVNKLNSISFQQKKYESVIIKNIKIDWTNQIAWAIIPKNSYLKFGLDKPSSMIYLLQNLKGIKMCSTIYYCPIANEWKGSLRSKEKDISIVAKKYNGGGHKLASGFKIKNKNEFKNVIKDLKNL
jgi:phosphoesterase RecJ-like protein